MICRASVSRENVSLMVPPCLPVPWNRAALLSCGLFRLAGAGLLPFLFLASLDEVGEAFLLLQQEVLAHSAGLGQRQNDLILVFMQVIAGNHPGSQHHPRVAQQRSAQQSAPGCKTGGSQHCTMSDGISRTHHVWHVLRSFLHHSVHGSSPLEGCMSLGVTGVTGASGVSVSCSIW